MLTCRVARELTTTTTTATIIAILDDGLKTKFFLFQLPYAQRQERRDVADVVVQFGSRRLSKNYVVRALSRRMI